MFGYFCTLNQMSHSRRISCIMIQSNLKLGGHLTDMHFAEYKLYFFRSGMQNHRAELF